MNARERLKRKLQGKTPIKPYVISIISCFFLLPTIVYSFFFFFVNKERKMEVEKIKIYV